MIIKVILCQNNQQCKHYFEQELSHPKNEEKKYHASYVYLEIANDEERIMFFTPDRINNLVSIRINSYEEMGTPWEHPKYFKAKEFIMSRLIN